MMRSQRGFSLIELLITLAIAAILTAVALPNYQAYMRHARRIEATATLLQAANWLERAATATGEYPQASADGSVALPSSLQQSANGHYLVTWQTNTAQGFVLIAQPQGEQARDACGWLSLDALGQRGAQGDVQACWQH